MPNPPVRPPPAYYTSLPPKLVQKRKPEQVVKYEIPQEIKSPDAANKRQTYKFSADDYRLMTLNSILSARNIEQYTDEDLEDEGELPGAVTMRGAQGILNTFKLAGGGPEDRLYAVGSPAFSAGTPSLGPGSEAPRAQAEDLVAMQQYMQKILCLLDAGPSGRFHFDELFGLKSYPPPKSLLWESNDLMDCSLCHVEFSLFNRRHHCRFCGLIICSSCEVDSLEHTDLIIMSELVKEERCCRACIFKSYHIVALQYLKMMGLRMLLSLDHETVPGCFQTTKNIHRMVVTDVEAFARENGMRLEGGGAEKADAWIEKLCELIDEQTYDHMRTI